MSVKDKNRNELVSWTVLDTKSFSHCSQCLVCHPCCYMKTVHYGVSQLLFNPSLNLECVILYLIISKLCHGATLSGQVYSSFIIFARSANL